jgi:2-(1,2-epoxy-1,2-dihydrophenyl)acetyl-CoA isomerase
VRSAAPLGAGPRIALRYMKRNLNNAEEGGLEQLLDAEVQRLIRAYMTEDHKEAVRAFLDKRPPVFKGQ